MLPLLTAVSAALTRMDDRQPKGILPKPPLAGPGWERTVARGKIIMRPND
jgi:hypothetical protein